jgi:hypothetical protein
MIKNLFKFKVNIIQTALKESFLLKDQLNQ